MSPKIVLWIYIVFLEVGGLMGFLKGKSKVSLIVSSVAASLLILCNLGIFAYPHVADIILAALLVVFAIRLAKTHKFMPSGMLLVATLVVLVLRNVHLS
jgi:uncharacterized membrane protein (UPF0136 family)